MGRGSMDDDVREIYQRLRAVETEVAVNKQSIESHLVDCRNRYDSLVKKVDGCYSALSDKIESNISWIKLLATGIGAIGLLLITALIQDSTKLLSF